jgi:hypothetical protein
MAWNEFHQYMPIVARPIVERRVQRMIDECVRQHGRRS